MDRTEEIEKVRQKLDSLLTSNFMRSSKQNKEIKELVKEEKELLGDTSGSGK